MTTADELLTADEVAPILRMHKVTVLRKARTGEIESVLMGRNRRFRRSAIDAYLDQCTVSATGSRTASARTQPATASTRPSRNPDRTYKT